MVNRANHYCCSESIIIMLFLIMNHEPWTDWLVQEPGSWIHNIFLHQLSWSLTARPWKGESRPKHPFSAAVAVTLPGVYSQRFTGWFFPGLAMVSFFSGRWGTGQLRENKSSQRYSTKCYKVGTSYLALLDVVIISLGPFTCFCTSLNGFRISVTYFQHKFTGGVF